MSYSNPFRRRHNSSAGDANTHEYLNNEYSANGFQDVPLSTFSSTVMHQNTNPFIDQANQTGQNDQNDQNDQQRLDFNANTAYDPPQYMTRSPPRAQHHVPYPSVDRIPELTLPTNIAATATATGVLDNNRNNRNSSHTRHSYLLHSDTEGAAAIEAMSEPSAIFRDDQNIDLVTGLRNLLGSGGFQDSWLSQNPHSQLPYPDDPNETTDYLSRDEEESIGMIEHTPISTVTPAAALPTTIIPPMPALSHTALPSSTNRVRFSLQEQQEQPQQPRSTSPVRISRLSTSSVTTPRKSSSSGRSQVTSRLSSGALISSRPGSPAVDENIQGSAFSRAVNKFSNRIVTGDASGLSLPPERPSSPAHSYNSVEDTDADLTDDDSAALTPLSPNTLVRYEHPDGIAVSTSTDSIAGLIAPSISPSTSQSLTSPGYGVVQDSQGQMSAGIVTDLNVSPINSVGSGTSTIPIPALATAGGGGGGGGDTIPPRPSKVELFGYSLGIFSKDNRLRLFLYHKVVSRRWFKTLFLLVLIAHLGVLTALTAPDDGGPNSPNDRLFMTVFHHQVYDWVILGIFIFYTLTAIISAIAVGLIFDSKNSALTFTFNSKKHTLMSAPKIFKDEKHRLASNSFSSSESFNDPANRLHRTPNINFDKPITIPAPERAYLRTTWSRIDFIAIISYWISFGLQANNTAQRLELYVFRCLTGLPILRLLNITRRTALILRSLKVGASRIWTIFLFIAFFW